MSSFNGLSKAVAILLVPFLLLMPVLPAVAQAPTSGGNGNAATACMQGQTDARANVSGGWFFAGCLGLVGLLVAYLVAPTPPATALMGKSPEYVALYTDCYRSAGKSAQGNKALLGCIVLGAVEVAVITVLTIAAANDASSSSPY